MELLPRWHRLHHAALRDALISFLHLRSLPDAHEKIALHIVLRHREDAELARCMEPGKFQAVVIGSRAATEPLWRGYMRAREHYAAQLRQAAPDEFLGAGLLLLSVKRGEDVGGDANYPVVIPLPRRAGATGSQTYWDALLLIRLAEGVRYDPRDREVALRLPRMYTHNLSALRRNPREAVPTGIAESE